MLHTRTAAAHLQNRWAPIAIYQQGQSAPIQCYPLCRVWSKTKLYDIGTRTHDTMMRFPQGSDCSSDGSRCTGSSSDVFSVLSVPGILKCNGILMTWAKGLCELRLLSNLA